MTKLQEVLLKAVTVTNFKYMQERGRERESDSPILYLRLFYASVQSFGRISL